MKLEKVNSKLHHQQHIMAAHEMKATVSDNCDPLPTGHNLSVNDDSKSWHCHVPVTRQDDTGKMARNQLLAVSILCFLFMAGELIGGVLSNSLALYTDVLHLASDLISFIISLTAIYLAKKPATVNMSFGYHRAEVLGALISVFFIWAVTGVLIYVAAERIAQKHYKDVKPDEMLITAVLGVVFNIIMAIVLQCDICCGQWNSRRSFGHSHTIRSSEGEGHLKNDRNGSLKLISQKQKNSKYQTFPFRKEGQLSDEEQIVESEDKAVTAEHHRRNINVRAAFIHVLGDILQSLGVLLAAIIIIVKPDDRYKLADPICTFLFSILVLFTTINVLRDAIRIILEGVPRDICYRTLKSHLEDLPGVQTVHDLTVWSLTLDQNAIAVHLAIDKTVGHQQVLIDAYQLLRDNYNFLQSTIQVEYHQPEIMAGCISCKEVQK